MKNAILEIVQSSRQGIETEEICQELRRSPQQLGDAFQDLREEGRIVGFAGLWLSHETLNEARSAFLDALMELHDAQPKEPGFPAAKIAAGAGIPWRGKPLDRFVQLLHQEKHVFAGSGGVRDRRVPLVLTPKQRAFLNRVLEQLEANFPNTPNPHQMGLLLGVPKQATEEILRLGVEAGEVVALDEVVYYTPDQLKHLAHRSRQAMGTKPFAASDLRDALATTRKYVAPLLAYFDAQGITEIRGETRVFTELGPESLPPASDDE